MNKHRGKRTADGKWVIGDLVTETDGDLNVIRSFIHLRLSPIEFNGDSLTSKLCLHEVEPETVGQYTNYYGLEFYDGDVISVDCDCDSEYGCTHSPGKYLVVWNEETAGYALKNLNNRIFYSLDNYGEENMHNIGNRWDNPDLLEGEKI
jgi:hypothetical protein